MLLKIYQISIIVLLGVNYSQECPPADTLQVTSEQNLWDIPYYNNWEGLEIMTWNVKTFPLSINSPDFVTEIVSDLLPDVINFQEIIDYNSLQILENQLPFYEFIIITGDEYYGLVIAVRKDCVELLNYSTLFNNNDWEFSYRPPLSADL